MIYSNIDINENHETYYIWFIYGKYISNLEKKILNIVRIQHKSKK
jgi:hypothetical protein